MLEHTQDRVEPTWKALDHFLKAVADGVLEELGTESPSASKTRPREKPKPTVGELLSTNVESE
jgi:hypothetical protein